VFSIDRADLVQRWAKLSGAKDTPAPAPAPLHVPVPVPVPVLVLVPAPEALPEATLPVVVVPEPLIEAVSIIEPAAEALANQAWVKAMPADAFVVQYAAMPTFQAANAWKNGIPALRQARIVAVYRPRVRLAYFVVISGPSTSRALATESGSARGKPAGAWVRTARSLRDQFNSEPVAAGPLQETTP
jgi:septal ring-binding cell division protein DamX